MAEINRAKLIRGGTLSAGVVLVAALTVMANYLAARHYQRWDWTSTELYSLSEKSLAVIADIDRDIDAVMFLSPGSEIFEQVDELLSRYAAANPRIKKRVIDPVRNRLEAQSLVDRFGIERNNVVVLAADQDRRVLDEADFADYDYSGAQFGQGPTLEAFKGEQLITSAILELIENQKPQVLFTTGHGEATLEPGSPRALSAAQDLLGEDNFAIDSWGSLGQAAVPAGTDLVVVAGPTGRFLEPELALFDAFLEGGGRLLLLLDPALDASGQALADLGLGGWLRGYGVQLDDDIVIDPVQQLPFYGPETLFTADYGVHPIVAPLEQTGRPVLLPLARSVRRADDADSRFEVVELVRSSGDAWGETDLASLPDVEPGDGDPSGPLGLGVAVSFAIERPQPAADATDASDATDAGDAGDGEDAAGDEDDAAIGDDLLAGDLDDLDDSPLDPQPETESSAEQARLVVFGDFDFASDSQVANGANAALLLNTLNWLIEREHLLAIEPRRPEQTRLTMSPGELSSLYLILFLMPVAAIVAGVVVFLKRRR